MFGKFVKVKYESWIGESLISVENSHAILIIV